MPYVRIEITDGATYEQKLQIYKETTEMLVRILNKKPEYTFVVIEEVANENWGHMGTSVEVIRKREAAERDAATGNSPARRAVAAASSKPSKSAPVRKAAKKPAKAAKKPAKAAAAKKPAKKAAAKKPAKRAAAKKPAKSAAARKPAKSAAAKKPAKRAAAKKPAKRAAAKKR
jgi:4-oxalocrotonate tautomerase family enzyme